MKRMLLLVNVVDSKPSTWIEILVIENILNILNNKLSKKGEEVEK